jgi:hypothetical protein
MSAAAFAISPGIRGQSLLWNGDTRNSPILHPATRKATPPTIKRELVALLRSGAQTPVLRSDERWLKKESTLLQQLGELCTRSAVRVLVELTAFDLGTAGGEELRCHLLIASKRVPKLVVDELKRARNTCAPSYFRDGICKATEAWRDDLHSLRRAVEQGDQCSID